VALYVYGVVEPKAATPSGKGIGGAKLSVVAGDDAAVLVSEVEDGPVRLGREAMLLHARCSSARSAAARCFRCASGS
jgi:hypothetical protein